ncbi:hypothetical protein [Ferrovibrio terrae]
MRAATIFAVLLMLSACTDPASMFAGGVRGWCKSSPSCTVQD